MDTDIPVLRLEEVKMKLASILILGATLAAAPALAQTRYVAADNSLGTQLCISAATATPIGMVMELKETHLSYHFLANNLRCNDMSVGRFAAEAGNDRVASQFLRRMKQQIEIKDVVAKADVSLMVQGSL
ncbi:DUF3718 domain-containing protein [Gallaecimonas pentaromativorans]|uniref:DUF3718 domain-containing protein n=1 Tax=Gallaecimonas pentaromativorans TaxID=584787 RepID=UPI0009F8FE49|nr:DUF3718 domain-containing protein [Gallaecimonas pentaromativorans]